MSSNVCSIGAACADASKLKAMRSVDLTACL